MELKEKMLKLEGTADIKPVQWFSSCASWRPVDYIECPEAEELCLGWD